MGKNTHKKNQITHMEKLAQEQIKILPQGLTVTTAPVMIVVTFFACVAEMVKIVDLVIVEAVIVEMLIVEAVIVRDAIVEMLTAAYVENAWHVVVKFLVNVLWHVLEDVFKAVRQVVRSCESLYNFLY